MIRVAGGILLALAVLGLIAWAIAPK